MPRAKTVDLTPNLNGMFQRSLDAAKGEARRIAKGDFGNLANPLTDHDRVEITRRIQNLCATLNIAIHSLSSVEQVQQIREALEDITLSIEMAADRIENGEEPNATSRRRRTENGTGKEA